METGKPKLETFSSDILELPSLAGLSKMDLSGVDPERITAGQKNVAKFVGAVALILVAYVAWVFIIPALAVMFSKLISAIAAVALVGLSLALAKPFVKLLSIINQKALKALIEAAPFEEMERQIRLLQKDQATFTGAKADISAAQTEMQRNAQAQEDLAFELQERIKDVAAETERFQKALETAERVHGKDSPEYGDVFAKYMEFTTDASLLTGQYNQAKSLVMRYGVYANSMKKVLSDLNIAGVAINVNIKKVQADITILQNEFDFANKSKTATAAAKLASGLTRRGELEYAMQVASSQAARNLAETRENIRQLRSVTSQYKFDPEATSAKLQELVDKIKSGAELVPSAERYASTHIELTAKERKSAGPLGEF